MKAKTRASLIILALVVLAFLFLQTPLMRTVRAAAWNTLTAAVGKLFGAGTQTLQDDVQQKMEALLAENISLKSKLADYGRLKGQLGTPDTTSLRAIPAAVVSRGIDTFQSRYIVSKGIRDGVSLGAPVVLAGSTLVGTIVDVTERTSTLELVLAPNTNLTAEIIPEDPDMPLVKGLLTGQHYTSLRLSTIPRDIKLHNGQAVVTAASESLPGGLMVGTLGGITNKENEPYQTAGVITSWVPHEISAVHILVQP
ncbi:MAG: rod shape-determining protein MreC [Candidatus Andersenbacteria bacterium]|nr:rod shape-determining protein MreC [Candidatus Andersenbacteria bacterium]